MFTTRSILLATALCLVTSSSARADENPGVHPNAEEHQALPDLGFGNLFSAGWTDEWVHRHDRFTPDMALLRVTTNFLERELRLDYSETDVRGNPKVDTQTLGNGLIAYSLNRRIMLEIINNYQWNKDFAGHTTSGSGGGALVRLQLVDTATRALSFQVKVTPPNKGLAQTQTALAYGLAAWQDLHAVLPGLGRMGLFESVQYEDLKGALPKAGARTKDLAADVSLARTWTSRDTPGFRNFTTFFEAYATRDLDGLNEGHTITTLTPGIRNWFSPKQSFTLGEDLPIGARGPSYRVLRATYILNF